MYGVLQILTIINISWKGLDLPVVHLNEKENIFLLEYALEDTTKATTFSVDLFVTAKPFT